MNAAENGSWITLQFSIPEQTRGSCLCSHLFNGSDSYDKEEGQAAGDWGSRGVYH